MNEVPWSGSGQVVRTGEALPAVHHMGMVVSDLRRSLTTWGQGLGFGPAHVTDADLPNARLANGLVGCRLRAAYVWTGHILLEFLQPMDDRSPHAAFLKEHGEGLHHLGFLVRSIDETLDGMAMAGDQGRPTMLIDALAGAADGMSMCYLDGGHAQGVVIELIERTPQVEDFLRTIHSVTGGGMPA